MDSRKDISERPEHISDFKFRKKSRNIYYKQLTADVKII